MLEKQENISHLNKFQANNSCHADKSKLKKYIHIFDSNFLNSSFKTIQNNIIYKKPSLNNNIENQKTEENNLIINELKDKIIHNETKLEKLNKTMKEIISGKNENQNISKEFSFQINELEKLKQENLTLKADSIIYREDILHLSEINRKLKIEYDLAQKKIFNLISKNEDSNQILNNKNFKIAQLTEAISEIKLSNRDETMRKIKNNRTKEQQIYEYEFELDGLNKEKIKIETEIKNLEEKYNTLVEEENKNEKEDEFYKIRINENIFFLEKKFKNLGIQMDELSVINKELQLKNKKYENNINLLKNETNNLIEQYSQKNEKINELEKEFKNLENKYSQILYYTRKRNFVKENDKNQETKNNYTKFKTKKSSKKLIVNDLFNKIKELKENIKSERKFND